MEWQSIDTAPKDKNILLFGAQREPFNCGIRYVDPLIFSGYWDTIDGAWCAHGTTYHGPFFHATHWMPLPEEPTFAPVKIPGL